MEFCITSNTKYFTLYLQHNKPNNICWINFPMHFGYCWCEKQRNFKSARVISLESIYKRTWWFSATKLTCCCLWLFFKAPCKKRYVPEKHTSYGIIKLKSKKINNGEWNHRIIITKIICITRDTKYQKRLSYLLRYVPDRYKTQMWKSYSRKWWILKSVSDCY